MFVLGVGGFMHDYNVCLVDVDKGRVAICEAERLSRRKHHVIRDGDDLMAPIEKVCADLGTKPKRIDVVAFAHTDDFKPKAWFRKTFSKARFVEVDHHRCHLAGAYYSSGYDDALILSMDGFGDGASLLVATGEGASITEIARTDDHNSLGLEYLRATYHLGLGGYGAEGKTQGLAPYGEPTLFEAYRKEIQVNDDLTLTLSDQLRSQSSTLSVEGGYLNTQILTNRFLDAYSPRRIAPEPLTEVQNNLAASVQKLLESVALELCKKGQNQTGKRRLVLSGGVSLNSSMNGAILKSGLFDGIYALPMASDRGVALGAALEVCHGELGMARLPMMAHVFYGGMSDDKAAAKAMKKGGLKPQKTDDPHGLAAEALAKGEIVGFVQGRSEMGARALGHRSILADARKAEMKDIINARVKHREFFRPFAPAALAEKADTYFETGSGAADLSFMTFTVAARDAGKEAAPATVHVDGTARLQTVIREANPDFHKVISAFDQMTGVPVVLNTSFNDNDEPIVETASDAVGTFNKADMDLLIVGNTFCRKS
ncbi:MAG: carbamoyltransferase [Rhodospirillales bacterium]